jgi:hypothetical protein
MPYFLKIGQSHLQFLVVSEKLLNSINHEKKIWVWSDNPTSIRDLHLLNTQNLGKDEKKKPHKS